MFHNTDPFCPTKNSLAGFNSAMRACACDGAWPRSLTLLEELEKQKLQAEIPPEPATAWV
jgi:hypothetical protein